MTARRPNSPSRHERGNSLIAAILLSTACVAVSASMVGPALARHGAARQSQERAGALAVAQSGIDWGLASVRGSGGRIDLDFEEMLTILDTGTVTIEYVRGDRNGVDDDGDGTADEPEEARFTQISATGAVGGTRRGARVVVMGPTAAGTPEAALLLNFTAPVTAIRGNAFVIDGRDHDQDGNAIAGAAAVPALGTGGTAAQLIDQIAEDQYDQIIGSGGSPSVEERPLQDMDALVSAAVAGGFAELEPGTYPSQNLGLDSPAGVTPVTVCEGDLHLTGTSGGAGTLVVNGDLHISGDFTWAGTILVRGALRLTGGGKSKRLLGAVVVGDGIEGHAYSAVDISSMSVEAIAELDADQQAEYAALETEIKNGKLMIWDADQDHWVKVAPDSDAYALTASASLESTAYAEYAEAPPQLTKTVTTAEPVWVPMVDADGGGYYETQTVTTTVLVEGVDPILELAGNIEILYSEELALAAAAAADPEMFVLAWSEFGVAP